MLDTVIDVEAIDGAGEQVTCIDIRADAVPTKAVT